jgi:HEAT repeat protein
MVLKPGQPPMGTADYPRAVANFLKALSDPDDSARAAAAFSLGYLGAEPDRTVPGLALAAICDRDPKVKQAAVDGLRRFGLTTCRDTSGCLWPAIAAIL